MTNKYHTHNLNHQTSFQSIGNNYETPCGGKTLQGHINIIEGRCKK